MKSFFTYLTLGILLLICYCEKKYACSIREKSKTKPSAGIRVFTGGFTTRNESFGRIPHKQIHLKTTDNFIKKSFIPFAPKTGTGSIDTTTDQNGLMLFELADKKMTGTFTGTLENRNNYQPGLSDMKRVKNNAGRTSVRSAKQVGE